MTGETERTPEEVRQAGDQLAVRAHGRFVAGQSDSSRRAGCGGRRRRGSADRRRNRPLLSRLPPLLADGDRRGACLRCGRRGARLPSDVRAAYGRRHVEDFPHRKTTRFQVGRPADGHGLRHLQGHAKRNAPQRRGADCGPPQPRGSEPSRRKARGRSSPLADKEPARRTSPQFRAHAGQLDDFPAGGSGPPGPGGGRRLYERGRGCRTTSAARTVE